MPPTHCPLNRLECLLFYSDNKVHKMTFTMSVLAERVIMELNVPGIHLDFLKRPHDLALRLLVQDLCLVDRIQTFGPEYELVVCSSGRSLFGFSPPVPMTTPIDSTGHASNLKWNASMASLSAELFEEAESGGCGSGALLSLMYTLVKPLSPQHPANLEEEELQEGEGLQEGVGLEGEAVIHRINIQCTAVDAIGAL